MGKPTKPVRLDDETFCFEYENEEDAKELNSLTEFEFQGVIFKVKRVVPVFETSGYYSFFVKVV